MARGLADGLLRLCNGAWRDDDGDAVDIVEVVHGYWIRMSDNPLVNKFTCSVCGRVSLHGNYCPNCGAKMDGDGERRTDGKID